MLIILLSPLQNNVHLTSQTYLCVLVQHEGMCMSRRVATGSCKNETGLASRAKQQCKQGVKVSEVRKSLPSLRSGYRTTPASTSHRCFPLLCVSSIRGVGCASHMRMVRSSEHDANIRGSRGFQATEFTLPTPCPPNVSRSSPVSRCQT